LCKPKKSLCDWNWSWDLNKITCDCRRSPMAVVRRFKDCLRPEVTGDRQLVLSGGKLLCDWGLTSLVFRLELFSTTNVWSSCKGLITLAIIYINIARLSLWCRSYYSQICLMLKKLKKNLRSIFKQTIRRK
jgi:hypothetical protein